MKKFKVIIRNGMHFLLTPEEQELPRILSTSIEQDIYSKEYNGMGREGKAEVLMFCGPQVEDSVKFENEKFTMPNGEELPYLHYSHYPKGKRGEFEQIKITVLVEFPYDTIHRQS